MSPVKNMFDQTYKVIVNIKDSCDNFILFISFIHVIFEQNIYS